MRECLAFDDVLLVPGYSEKRSRVGEDIDTSTNVGGIELRIPLISSPMDTVTEADMAIALGRLGGMGVIHRFASMLERIEMGNQILDAHYDSGIKVPLVLAVGVTEEEKNIARELMEHFHSNLDMISIDIANGHHILMKEMVEYIRGLDGEIPIMAGNVATESGFRFLADLGVNAVRVGIGGGSICKTRIQTGFGVPTLTSVMDCARAKKDYPNVAILADGGIKYPKDLSISLKAGADAVVLGSLFAGTKEAPGGIIYTNDGKAWKNYRGMASAAVQEDKRGGMKPGTTAEGVSQLTEYKGSLERVITDFIGGLRAGMAMVNASNLQELRSAEMIKITSAGISESHAHGTRR